MRSTREQPSIIIFPNLIILPVKAGKSKVLNFFPKFLWKNIFSVKGNFFRNELITARSKSAITPTRDDSGVSSFRAVNAFYILLCSYLSATKNQKHRVFIVISTPFLACFQNVEVGRYDKNYRSVFFMGLVSQAKNWH